MRKFLVAATAALLAAVPANAVIVSGTLTGGSIVTNGGTFQVTNLATIQVNTINSANILGINEAQKVTLGAAVRAINVDTPNGTTISLAQINANSTLIAAGTRVNSHMIILDPTDGTGSRNATGSVTFNGKILGYIVHTTNRNGATFAETNFLGAPGTTYGPLHPSLEGAGDGFAIGGSGNKTLTFSMASARNVGDYIRVITAVPEPRSWAMMLAGFGMVGFGLRRRRTAVAA
ncbi:hypothetical protein CAP39_03550 [Sphingomonas sp. IBVSS1]|nr:hypothetical protein CAP39_03550 [Sphingomonas sp. IBVSS1]